MQLRCLGEKSLMCSQKEIYKTFWALPACRELTLMSWSTLPPVRCPQARPGLQAPERILDRPALDNQTSGFPSCDWNPNILVNEAFDWSPNYEDNISSFNCYIFFWWTHFWLKHLHLKRFSSVVNSLPQRCSSVGRASFKGLSLVQHYKHRFKSRHGIRW